MSRREKAKPPPHRRVASRSDASPQVRRAQGGDISAGRDLSETLLVDCFSLHRTYIYMTLDGLKDGLGLR